MKPQANGVAASMLSAALAICAAGAAWAQSASDPAQKYPNRPIRLIAQFPPGSATDIGARTIGQKLTEAWGQQVVIDTRAGAGGRIGTELGAKATPDGYTLTMSVAGPMSVAPALYPNLGYQVLRDFAPIANLVTQAQVVLAHLALPVKSMPELVENARKSPGSLSYASTGPGALTHLAMELIQSAAKIRLNHVPYKVTAVAHTDLMAGQVQTMVDSLPSALALIKTGKVRGLAVTSLERQKLAPELPTVAESGYPGVEVIGWLGVVAPAKTPEPLLAKLAGELVRIADAADTQERFHTLGFTTRTMTRGVYAEFIRAETDKWVKVVKEAGVKVEG
jgi:tripartite-type tricarboxylate transporter receptor subunit TctC